VLQVAGPPAVGIRHSRETGEFDSLCAEEQRDRARVVGVTGEVGVDVHPHVAQGRPDARHPPARRTAMLPPRSTSRGELVERLTASVQGNIKPLRSLAEPLQVAMDNGAKRALIPIENKRSFLDVDADVVEHVDPIFYGDPKTAAMKGLGVS
jgi:hypothetical protein